MSARSRARSRQKRGQGQANLQGIAHGLGFATLAAFLLPFHPESPLLAPAIASSLAAYLHALPEQFYFLIKALLPWVPLGLIAALGARGRWLPSLPMLAAGLLVASLPLLPQALFGDLLEALYALPGLTLGLWLGGRLPMNTPVPREAQATATSMDDSVRREEPTPQTDTPEHQPSPAEPEAIGGREGSRHRGRRHRHKRNHHSSPYSIPLILFGAASLLLALIGVIAFPIGALPLFLGLLVYAGLLWRFPLVWLVLVPAALPLLDLAPWSGRFFFDEFDLLMLTTVGILLLRGRAPSGRKLTAIWPLFALWGGAILISALVGLGAPPPLDANAFTNYWSAYNSPRVAKGLLWGGLLFFLLRLTRPDPAQLASRLAIGMGIGLLGVGLVGLWERWLFAGFSDADHAYRIVSTFSSMHTGGGHIEAYLAAALPFLWLGLARWKTLPLALAVMALTVYVTIFTVARGGALALGVILLTLIVASLRQAWGTRQRWLAAIPVGALLLLAAGLLAGISVGYFQQRLAQSSEDWDIRVAHWKEAIAMMDTTPLARIFGMGLGSFPRVYLERGPADRQPATFGFMEEIDNTFLRLGSGDTLYYAQRVAVRAGEQYRLELDARSQQQGARIETPVCEKQLLNSRRCVWISLDVPGDGHWHRLTHDFSSGEVGVEEGLRRPPVELFLYYPGRNSLLDIDNVRLLDATGANLIGNGGFSWAADYWFFKTHSHLPWHIKNVWVHVLFEQGWLGLLLFTSLIGLALARLARIAWAGEPLAWACLASLLGLLSVGMFDSLLDTPRLATLLLALTYLGLAYDWAATPKPVSRGRGGSRHARVPAATHAETAASTA